MKAEICQISKSLRLLVYNLFNRAIHAHDFGNFHLPENLLGRVENFS